MRYILVLLALCACASSEPRQSYFDTPEYKQQQAKERAQLRQAQRKADETFCNLMEESIRTAQKLRAEGKYSYEAGEALVLSLVSRKYDKVMRGWYAEGWTNYENASYPTIRRSTCKGAKRT